MPDKSITRSWTVHKPTDKRSVLGYSLGAQSYKCKRLILHKVDGGWAYHHKDYTVVTTKVNDSVRPYVLTYKSAGGAIIAIQSYSIQWGLQQLADRGLIDF